MTCSWLTEYSSREWTSAQPSVNSLGWQQVLPAEKLMLNKVTRIPLWLLSLLTNSLAGVQKWLFLINFFQTSFDDSHWATFVNSGVRCQQPSFMPSALSYSLKVKTKNAEQIFAFFFNYSLVLLESCVHSIHVSPTRVGYLFLCTLRMKSLSRKWYFFLAGEIAEQ